MSPLKHAIIQTFHCASDFVDTPYDSIGGEWLWRSIGHRWHWNRIPAMVASILSPAQKGRAKK